MYTLFIRIIIVYIRPRYVMYTLFGLVKNCPVNYIFLYNLCAIRATSDCVIPLRNLPDLVLSLVLASLNAAESFLFAFFFVFLAFVATLVTVLSQALLASSLARSGAIPASISARSITSHSAPATISALWANYSTSCGQYF